MFTKLRTNSLEWIATALSFAGSYANSTGNHFILAMSIWIVANGCWILYALPRKQYALITTQLGFCLIQIYGLTNFLK